MTSRHLYEMIDACRPGHDDINQPAFAELKNAMSQDPDLQRLFARSQAVDSAIRTAFQAVTPPPGFANRLIEAIETAAIGEGDGTSIAVADSELRVELATRPSRRTFAIWTGASLSAVAATIAFWLMMSQPVTSITDQSIAESVDQWNVELDKAANWQSAANLPAQDFPTWQHLKISDGDRWQWVSKRRVVCYDFEINPREDGEIVRLFISQSTSAVSLPANPPVGGYPSPDGWYVGAWQANGRVYYLAVYANSDSKSLYSRVIRTRINTA